MLSLGRNVFLQADRPGPSHWPLPLVIQWLAFGTLTEAAWLWSLAGNRNPASHHGVAKATRDQLQDWGSKPQTQEAPHYLLYSHKKKINLKARQPNFYTKV